jgi:hypothetical protein
MPDETKHANANGHGDYERRDISAAAVLYFLGGLAVAMLGVYLIVMAVFRELDKHEEQQTAMSPLVTNAPKDTRHLPSDYKTDDESKDYEKYLQKNFPAPQLETDERDQLNKIRLNEEQILSTYGYVDKQSGVVRIPIERAMDLIAQRGLPVREQTGAAETNGSAANDRNNSNKAKETK